MSICAAAHITLRISGFLLATAVWALVFSAWMLEDTYNVRDISALVLLAWGLLVWIYLGFALVVPYFNRKSICNAVITDIVLGFVALATGVVAVGYATQFMGWWWARMWRDGVTVYPDNVRVKSTLLFTTLVVSWALVATLLLDWWLVIIGVYRTSGVDPPMSKSLYDLESEATLSGGEVNKSRPTIQSISAPIPSPPGDGAAVYPYRSFSPARTPQQVNRLYGVHGLDTVTVSEPQPKRTARAGTPPRTGVTSRAATRTPTRTPPHTRALQVAKETYHYLRPSIIRRPSTPSTFGAAYPPTCPSVPSLYEEEEPSSASSPSSASVSIRSDWSPTRIVFSDVPSRALEPSKPEVHVEYNNYLPRRQ